MAGLFCLWRRNARSTRQLVTLMLIVTPQEYAAPLGRGFRAGCPRDNMAMAS